MTTLPFWPQSSERPARWDVPAHPFYRRWAGGELTASELASYASEYEHAVLAVAAAWRRAADLDDRFERRADEARSQVRLWRVFAKETGWGGWGGWAYGEDPLPATRECSLAWGGGEDRGLREHLISLCAIESVSAATSPLLLTGLLDHYGFEDGPATEYFWRQTAPDDEKGLLVRGWLADALLEAEVDALLEHVETVHRAHWMMLDGLEALGARS